MATNVLGPYSPIFYAQEALIQLRNRMGLANRIYMGYDAERRTFGKGQTISIPRPATYTAAAAPASTIQDTAVGTVNIELTTWQEVRFSLTDKELAYTGQKIVSDHISPAAYALANKIDQDIAALALGVPHVFIEGTPGTATVAGILGTDKILFDNKVPTFDLQNMHFMIGGKEKQDLLALAAFGGFNQGGQPGVNTQQTGEIGQRYGYNFFANQNRPTVTYADTTDVSGTITEPAAVGATSITVGGFGATDVLEAGTILKFTVSGKQYAVTTDTTMVGGAAVVPINPAISVAEADNAALTGVAGQDNVTANVNLAFHRNWAALAFAKLPDFGEYNANLGADMATVQDDDTGLSIRATIFYDALNSQMVGRLDVLYGVKELDSNLACRYQI